MLPPSLAGRSPLVAALLAALALPACAGGEPAAEAPPRPSAAAPPAAACLSIVAWNDMHGQLSADTPVIDTGRVPAGGVIAAADQVAAIRATGDDVVVLDAGDLFTGPIESTLAEGAPIIDAYKVLGVDAAAIGNHDFDFGPVGYARVTAPKGVGDEAGADGPRGALLARMTSASFPFLSANVRRAGGAPTGWPHHRPWARIARGHYDVGVVGYTTMDVPKTTLKANVADLEFPGGAAAAGPVGAAIREARAAGSAPVVLLAHASLDGELPQELGAPGERSGELAALVAALGRDLPDVIVAGHRHAWMLGRVGGVPIVSSDWHGVGLARIRFCGGGSAPKLDSIDRRVTMAVTPPASDLGVKVAAAVAPWQARVKAEADAPVVTLARECVERAPLGAALGDQIARAMAGRVADAAAPPRGVPVVGLINSGALRAPLPSGHLRFADLFAVLPFENAVAVCGTTRAGLLRVVNNAFKKTTARERFPLGLAGVKVRLRKGADGPQVAGVEIDGEPKGAKDDAPVWLAVSDFMLAGGDGLLDGVTCSPGVTSATSVRDAWRALLVKEQGGCEGGSKNVVME